MKKTKLGTKTDAELVKLVAEKREELRAMRFAAAGARAKDPSLFGKSKKEIARALLELATRAKASPATSK